MTEEQEGGPFYNLAVAIFKLIGSMFALAVIVFCLGAVCALGVKGYEMLIPPPQPPTINYNVNLPPTFDVTTHQECTPEK
jgi:hypothetical protein